MVVDLLVELGGVFGYVLIGVMAMVVKRDICRGSHTETG